MVSSLGKVVAKHNAILNEYPGLLIGLPDLEEVILTCFSVDLAAAGGAAVLYSGVRQLPAGLGEDQAREHFKSRT